MIHRRARQGFAVVAIAVVGTVAVYSNEGVAAPAKPKSEKSAAKQEKSAKPAKNTVKSPVESPVKKPVNAGPSTGSGRIPSGVYEVKPGDTLSTIARKAGVSIGDIQDLNEGLRPNALRVGAKLKMPKPQNARNKLPATLRNNPSRLKLRPVIRKWAKRNSIPADLVEATLYLESGWNQRRVSSVGAVGVGQLMPDTAAYIRSELIGDAAGGASLDEDVAEHNVRMSARYLRHLLTLSNGNVTKALHGYYQGFGSISENGLYPETRQYAASIQSLRSRFRADPTGINP